jgi:hypothetical protein
LFGKRLSILSCIKGSIVAKGSYEDLISNSNELTSLLGTQKVPKGTKAAAAMRRKSKEAEAKRVSDGKALAAKLKQEEDEEDDESEEAKVNFFYSWKNLTALHIGDNFKER